MDPSLDAARRLRGGTLAHVPPGAAPIGAVVRLDLVAPAGGAPEVVLEDRRHERTWRVGLTPSGGGWTCEVRLPSRPTIVSYRFVLADGTELRERRQVEGKNEPVYGAWEELDHRIAVFDPAAAPPDWARGAVVYEIVPDRFARGRPPRGAAAADVYGEPALELGWGDRPERPPRSRDFFGGDLAGIEGRLDLLADLGVDCLYLTPIFASPSNHRYDALDYFSIDPRLGTSEDLRSLCDEARGRGVRVILDGVFNHCSSASPYFREAQADRAAPTYRWFEFTAWPRAYRAWADVAHMPQFAESPEVEEFFFGRDGVARHWLREGAAGWRLDVVPWKSDEFWRRFARSVREERPDAYLVAEEWGNATRYLLGDTFDAAMNYRFSHAVMGFASGRIGPSELDDRLETLRRDTPEPRLHTQLNLLDSHDTPRLLTMCGGDRDRVTLAVALQMAYPGAPMVYYGSEAAIAGEDAEDGRRAYPADPDPALFAMYRAAIRARRGSPALRHGRVRTVHVDDAARTYAFAREHGRETVLCVFNGATDERVVVLPADAGRPWSDLLGGPAPDAGGGELRVRLASHGAAYLGRSRA